MADLDLIELDVCKSDRMNCQKCRKYIRGDNGSLIPIHQPKVVCPDCGHTFCPSDLGKHHKVLHFDSITDALAHSSRNGGWGERVEHVVIQNVFGISYFMCLKD